MPRLFSYIVAHDNGSAPNPFWGVCTLVICKPAIRRAASIDDWVVGIGSVNSPVGDISRHVVYAMEVSRKMTMEEYDDFSKQKLLKKVPDWKNKDARRRMGDSIYDFSSNPPTVRKAVHNERHRDHDLGGQYALLSERFIYFGEKALKLPKSLLPIADCRRGHRSNSNNDYMNLFVKWISGQMKGKKAIVGNPSSDLFKRLNSKATSGNYCK